jgi:hypothetical protein
MAMEIEMPFIRNMIAKIFGLAIFGTIIASRERYNMDLGKYSLGAEVNHYVPSSSYLISQVATSMAWRRLKTLSEISTF